MFNERKQIRPIIVVGLLLLSVASPVLSMLSLEVCYAQKYSPKNGSDSL